MKHHSKLAAILFFGFIIAIKGYTVVIGQTKPVLAVLNKNDATLSIIDPATMKITASVSTGNSPHEVVISPDGKTAYAANYGDGPNPGSTLSVIDIATAKETRRVDLSPLMRPHGLIFLGGKLYFTAETNRAIARYDPAANKIDWMMGTGQNGSHMIVATADEKKFYTANIGSNNVTAIELASVPPAGSKITQIPVGTQPEAIGISPDGKEVWAGLNQGGAIDVVDTATNKLKQQIKIGGRAYRVRFTPDGKHVVNTILETKEILIVDAATKAEVKRIKLDSVPLGIVMSADSKTAFVTVVQPDEVLKIDLATGEITGRVTTGKVPDGIDVAGF